jgi:hypothetical protein
MGQLSGSLSARGEGWGEVSNKLIQLGSKKPQWPSSFLPSNLVKENYLNISTLNSGLPYIQSRYTESFRAPATNSLTPSNSSKEDPIFKLK